MSVIESTNRGHAATCCDSEGTRQQAVAAAILAGGGSATVAAAVRTAEIAHYRRIIASCLANGLQSAQFGQEEQSSCRSGQAPSTVSAPRRTIIAKRPARGGKYG